LDLANDLQAWLADEPVAVYREPLNEKLARWGRQHRNWLLFGVLSVALLMLAAFLAAAYQRKAAVTADSAHKVSMQIAAQFAATTLATEIDLRWRILSEHAADPELQQCLLDLAQGNVAAQQRLQLWVMQRKYVDEPTPSESWFIDDARGIQVARAPSANSINNSFRDRDYFHGRGRLTPEEAASAEPIRSVHRSTVYTSSNDGSLRVAFTVPIWKDNDRVGMPIGVLGMSVELGKFAALQTGLSTGQTAALVDLRENTIKDQTVKGLLLHHRDLQAARQQREDQGDPTPFCVDPQCVARLQSLTEERLKDPLRVKDSLDTNYHDPLSGRTITAVFEPVLIHSRRDPNAADLDADRDSGWNTGWIIVIQQDSPPNP
jgi:hypothetical protein